MAHVHRNRKQLLTRVRRIAGQVAALEQALDTPEGEAGDCAGVLVQVAAVRGAAHSLLMELLHEHLQEHVVGADDPQQRADEAAVLVELLRRYGK
ncbi:metal-sensing transcriptional repressor [Stenotrophomonas maltophilia]|uniref:metal-sensing transcriptional repressor n=1 Tax=Stenotrophomonas maltophilia TaxID=40324 RepID=UPI000D1A167E|nr:metal-sensing transcriptional repressor [Stenotrophomonas maltophilia]MBN5021885.1 metal-sensing transcriptional repressor [Stenotrophomonas maltophilia]